MTTHRFSQADERTAEVRGHKASTIQRTIVGLAVATACIGTMAVGTASAAPGDTSGDNTLANVGVLAGITMTGLTPSFTITGAPGATVTEANAVTFNVETNNVAGYAVTVRSTTETMNPPIGANLDTIPIGDLTVSDGGEDSYQSISGTGVITVHTQATRSANGGDALSNDFQIRIPVVNVDIYTATLDYVATTL